jgi:hypothetical protein
MSTAAEQTTAQTTELDRLINREEVLQICYWYQGESFGDEYSPPILNTFLNCQPEAIEEALVELCKTGYLRLAKGGSSSYKFTPKGKKEGGRLFADSFADLQKASHGECAAGCCDGDDHSQCGDACALH